MDNTASEILLKCINDLKISSEPLATIADVSKLPTLLNFLKVLEIQHEAVEIEQLVIDISSILKDHFSSQNLVDFEQVFTGNGAEITKLCLLLLYIALITHASFRNDFLSLRSLSSNVEIKFKYLIECIQKKGLHISRKYLDVLVTETIDVATKKIFRTSKTSDHLSSPVIYSSSSVITEVMSPLQELFQSSPFRLQKLLSDKTDDVKRLQQQIYSLESDKAELQETNESLQKKQQKMEIAITKLKKNLHNVTSHFEATENKVLSDGKQDQMQLSSFQRQISILRKENDSLNNILQTAVDEQIELSAKLENAHTRASSTSAERDRLISEVKELQEVCLENELLIENQKHAYSDVTDRLKDLEQYILENRRMNNTIEESIETDESFNMDVASPDIQNLSSQSLRSENMATAVVDIILEETRLELQELQKKHIALQRDFEESTKANEQQCLRIGELDSILEMVDQTETKLHTQLEAYHVEKTECEELLRNCRVEFSSKMALKDENFKQLQNDFSCLQNTHAEEIAVYEQQTVDLNIRIHELEQEGSLRNESYESQIETIQSSLPEHKSQVKFLEKKLSLQTTELSQLEMKVEARIGALVLELADAQNNLADYQTAQEALRRFEELTSKLELEQKDYKETLRLMQSARDSLEEKVLCINKEMNELMKKHEEESGELNGKIKSLESSMKRQVSDLTQMLNEEESEKHETLRITCNDYDEKISSLTRTIENLNMDLKTQTCNIQELKETEALQEELLKNNTEQHVISINALREHYQTLLTTSETKLSHRKSYFHQQFQEKEKSYNGKCDQMAKKYRQDCDTLNDKISKIEKLLMESQSSFKDVNKRSKQSDNEVAELQDLCLQREQDLAEKCAKFGEVEADLCQQKSLLQRTIIEMDELKQREESSSLKCSHLNERLTLTSNELVELQDLCVQHVADISKKNLKLNELNVNLCELKMLLKDKSCEIVEFKTKEETSNAKFEDLSERLKQSDTALTKLKNICTKYEQEISEKDSLFTELEANLSQLRMLVNDKTMQIHDLNKESISLHAKDDLVNNMKEHIAYLAQELRIRAQKMNDKLSRLYHLEKRLAGALDIESELRSKLAKALKEKSAIEGGISSYKEEINHKICENRNLQQKNNKYKEQLNSLATIIQNLEKQNTDDTRIARLERERQPLKDRLARVESDNKKLYSEKLSLKAQLITADSTLRVLQKQIQRQNYSASVLPVENRSNNNMKSSNIESSNDDPQPRSIAVTFSIPVALTSQASLATNKTASEKLPDVTTIRETRLAAKRRSNSASNLLPKSAVDLKSTSAKLRKCSSSVMNRKKNSSPTVLLVRIKAKTAVPLQDQTLDRSVPKEMAQLFQCEDKEDIGFSSSQYLFDLKNGRCSTDSQLTCRRRRMSELQRRNSILPPHLRSAYAAELHCQTDTVSEDQFRAGRAVDNEKWLDNSGATGALQIDSPPTYNLRKRKSLSNSIGSDTSNSSRKSRRTSTCNITIPISSTPAKKSVDEENRCNLDASSSSVRSTTSRKSKLFALEALTPISIRGRNRKENKKTKSPNSLALRSGKGVSPAIKIRRTSTIIKATISKVKSPWKKSKNASNTALDSAGSSDPSAMRMF